MKDILTKFCILAPVVFVCVLIIAVIVPNPSGMEVVLTCVILLALIYFIYHTNNIIRNHSRKANNPKHQQIFKSTSTKDNMNCDLYIFSGRLNGTKEIQKDLTIHVFGNDSVKDAIINLGYEEPIEFKKIDFENPTESQLHHLHNLIGDASNNVSSDDAIALINRYVEQDQIANPHLFKYATEMHIPVSYYCGKKRLYNLIFSGLDLRDQIAFFIFQIYRDSYDAKGSREIANLNNSPYKSFFYEFADQQLNNKSFIESMQKYSGKDLRFFGNRTYNGHQTTGGSKNTIAYKTAKDFLNVNIT